MTGIEQDIFKQLETEGYKMEISNDFFEPGKVRVEITKNGNTVGATIPKIEVSGPEAFCQKITDIKAMMELLMEETE